MFTNISIKKLYSELLNILPKLGVKEGLNSSSNLGAGEIVTYASLSIRFYGLLLTNLVTGVSFECSLIISILIMKAVRKIKLITIIWHSRPNLHNWREKPSASPTSILHLIRKIVSQKFLIFKFSAINCLQTRL